MIDYTPPLRLPYAGDIVEDSFNHMGLNPEVCHSCRYVLPKVLEAPSLHQPRISTCPPLS
jgi:hypothetical protein